MSNQRTFYLELIKINQLKTHNKNRAVSSVWALSFGNAQRLDSSTLLGTANC